MALEVTSTAMLNEQLAQHKHAPAVLYFWAEFSSTSKPSSALGMAFARLADLHKDVLFLQVDCDAQEEVAEMYSVDSVPTFVFAHEGREVGRLRAPTTSLLAQRVVEHSKLGGSAGRAGDASALHERLRRLINATHVMLFMKGSPHEPRCKFSRRMVEVLKEAGMHFGSFDILTDDTVREELKTFSNWPTYPQLYVGGQLIGGLDVVEELKETGDLAAIAASANAAGAAAGSGAAAAAEATAAPVPLEDRLRGLVSQAPVMLFMKGRPDAPRCGFSAEMVRLLSDASVKFGHFDILSDEEVRQGLKTFSNWPTYPQLYAQGKLVGGLDVVKELQSEGELADIIPAEARAAQ